MKLNACSLQAAMLLSLAQFAGPAMADINFAVVSTYTLPLGEIKDNKLQGGLVFDMTQAIAQEMKEKANYVLRPRKRIEPTLNDGEADIACYLNKKWVEQGADAYHWSPALFRYQTVVVGAADAPPAKSLDELQGKSVGGVLGFSYPNLNEMFASGKVTRDDAPDLEKNYMKLVAGRLQYIVVGKVEHDYYLKTSGQRSKFNNATALVSEVELFCALAKSSKIKPAALELAVNNIVKRGLPDQWLAKYR